MPSAAAEFWAAAFAFHLAVGAACVWLGRRWQARLQGRRRPPWLWGLQLAADAVLFSWAVGLAGVFAAVWTSHAAFSLARLWAQALFLEAPLLAAWIAGLHCRQGERRRGALPAGAALLLVAVYADAYHVEPRRLETRRYALHLGDGGRRLRIAHLSDLQTHRIGPHERRALWAARNARPDLVAFTGDYLQPLLGSDLAGPARDFRALLREVDLRPPAGAYAVPGDVDGPGWQDPFAGSAFTCLEDRGVTRPVAGGRLAIVGLTNATSRGREPGPLAAVLARVPPADLTLVLGHRPDGVRALPPGAGVDLMLAGHTHGGQVVLPFLGPPVTLSRLPRRIAGGGLHLVDGTWLSVSRGIGMERLTAPQVRFLCPPEVSILDVTW